MFRHLACLVALVLPVLGEPSGNVTRIFLGKETTIKDHPYIVSVQAFGKHMCGGTIISNRWIVTAAHCFKSKVQLLSSLTGLRFYSIRAGSTYHDGGGEVVYANKIIIHESFNWLNLDYDVALIQLRNKITSSSARPIAFAGEDDVPKEGTMATVSGWGYTHAGRLPNKLKSFDVPVVNPHYCRSMFDWFSLFITDRMLCAGNGNGKGAPCHGDSGGPLVVKNVLTGIVPRANICLAPTSPTTFTSVPKVSAWIKQHTC